MTIRTLKLDDDLYEYLLAISLREHPVLAEMRAANRSHPHGHMQISSEQGQFMALLARLIDARKTIDIGTFTGYSALTVALALPEGGKVVTCDMSAKFTDEARNWWERAGVAQKIELRLGPALETLDALILSGQHGSFDFAFIDADKTGYDAYYERSLQLLRQGGLIAIDNTLWRGEVSHPARSESTAAIQALNRKLRDDRRIDLSLVPIGDGLTLARKR